MIEDGYSIRSISKDYGIDLKDLSALWIKYQHEGAMGLKKKQYVRTDGPFRETVVRDIAENCLTLSEAAVKYDVSISRIKTWNRIARKDGYGALYKQKRICRPPKDMGRPKKKKPEEMTELERLRYENECLRTENALLKKVRALVEERNARLREIGQKPSKN
jgi:transposase-like protein